MKQATRQKFPPGWNEKKVLAVIAHYDKQTEDEAAAEIDLAPEAPGETWMSVPTELVGAVTRLIRDHSRKPSTARSEKRTKKGQTGKK